MPTASAAWNNETIPLLERLWKAGLSVSQIASQIPGATRSAVIGKVHRLGLTPRSNPISKYARRPNRERAQPSAPVITCKKEDQEISLPAAAPRPVMLLTEAAPLRIGEVVADGTPCVLTQLSGSGCKWGVDFQERQHLFCNKPQQVWKPYCPEHVLASISKAVGAFDDGENDIIRQHWDSGRGLHRLVGMLGRPRHAITRQAQYILKLPRAA